MDIVFKRIWRELWANRARTLIVILSLTVGAALLGIVVNTYGIVSEQLTASNARSRPPHVTVSVGGGWADQALIERLRQLPGMAAVEGIVGSLDVEWKPTLQADWQPALLVSRANYAQQTLDLIELRSGTWPDSKSVAVDFNAVGQYGGMPGLGGTLYLRINNRPRPLTVSAIVRDPWHSPPPAQTKPKIYVTPDVVEELTGRPGFLGLSFAVTEHSPANVEAALAMVEEQLQRAGLTVGFVQIHDPARHFAQAQVDLVFGLLLLIAAVCLGLSAILVANVMTVVMAVQVPQIGIMKAIGGRHDQIAALYLAGAGAYGVLSLAVALPLGMAGGYWLVGFVLWSLNVPAPSARLVPLALVLQLAAGLLIPLAAAAWPVWRGARMSVREALAAYGLSSSGYGTRLLDRVVTAWKWLPTLPLLALRNALRDPARLALLVLTLVVSGTAFITLLNARAAFARAVDADVRSYGFDVEVRLLQPQRRDEMVPLLQSLARVQYLEAWLEIGGSVRQAQAAPTARDAMLILKGVPEDGQMFQPQLVAGHALAAGNDHGVLLNQEVARALGLSLGDALTFEPGGRARESTWTIVGLVADDVKNTTPSGYVWIGPLSDALGEPGRTTRILIRADTPAPDAHRELAAEAVRRLEARGVESRAVTAAEETQSVSAEYDTPLTLLLVMIGLVLVLSGLGLAGTLSLHVVERRREIGLLRAIGAGRRDVALLFVGEGLVLGLLSWGAAAVLSLATSELFLLGVGQWVTFSLPRVYMLSGYGVWLGLVLAAGLLASGLPARAASRVSVRESLSYE